MIFSRCATAALSLAAFYTTTLAQTSSQACNNSPTLCNKPYNNVTYLGAHDSPFLRDQSTGFSTSGNQFYNTTVQLDAGVRLLTAQVHKANNTQTGATEWHLCHSNCILLDAGTLSKWLGEINAWMGNNPNDVVTVLLVNSDGATADQLGSEFQASGITQYAYTPSSSSAPSQWPTLRTMIQANTRLVTFVASLSDNSGHPYLMDEFAYVFENEFENTSPQSFSCNPSRPSSVANNPQAAMQSNRLFLMNHFLYLSQAFGIETPDTARLNTTNAVSAAPSSLGNRIQTCSQVYGNAPNYVIVDFFNVGPAIDSVDRANGIATPFDRKQVSSQQLVEQSSDASISAPGASRFAAVVGAVVAWIVLN